MHTTSSALQNPFAPRNNANAAPQQASHLAGSASGHTSAGELCATAAPACGSQRPRWDGATQVYVPPGRVTLVAQVNAVMLHGDFINLQADMEAGQSYALAATYDDGILSVRVEHEKTREPAGPTVQIPVGRPHWVK